MPTQPNIGTADRLIRFTLGIVFLAFGVSEALSPALTVAAYALAVLALVTAGLRFCPLYALLRIDSCGAREGRKPTAR